MKQVEQKLRETEAHERRACDTGGAAAAELDALHRRNGTAYEVERVVAWERLRDARCEQWLSGSRKRIDRAQLLIR